MSAVRSRPTPRRPLIVQRFFCAKVLGAGAVSAGGGKGLKILVSAVRSRPTPQRTCSLKVTGPFFMWYVYVLSSVNGDKTYTGFRNDVQ